jgi:TonB family protein
MTSRIARIAACLILTASIDLLAAPSQVGVAAALTPGAVALLSNRMDDAGVQTVIRAIGDEDPMVRSVAARIAAVTAHPPFGNPILAAWEKETDRDARAEQVRALLNIRGALAVPAIESRLASAGRPATGVYTEWLVRTQPEGFAEWLPRLAPRLADVDISMNPFVLAISETRPDLRPGILRSYLAVHPSEEWRALLGAASFESPGPDVEAVLLEALASPDADIRETTVWNLVSRLANRSVVSTGVLDAAAAVPPAESTAVDGAPLTWERFGRELIARRRSRKQTPDRSEFLAAEARGHLRDSSALVGIDRLTERELKAVRAALGDRMPKRSSDGPRTKAGKPSLASMRTMPTLWPGFLKKLFEAANCTVDVSLPLGIGAAMYRPDGRLAKLEISATAIPAGCKEAVTALVRLTVADIRNTSLPAGPEFLVLPLDPAFLECSSQPQAEDSETPHKPGSADEVGPPRKVRDLKPIYPASSQERRIVGAVVVEARIGPTGCVTGARVTRGVEPPLDLAALRAIAGWRFTPTLVNGRAVPIIMVVTVNFSLE